MYTRETKRDFFMAPINNFFSSFNYIINRQQDL